MACRSSSRESKPDWMPAQHGEPDRPVVETLDLDEDDAAALTGPDRHELLALTVEL
jgi:hypothetical protein